MSAAKEVRLDAAVPAVLSELDVIFTLKKSRTTLKGFHLVVKMFLLDSRLDLEEFKP